jgi:hypothetical protein
MPNVSRGPECGLDVARAKAWVRWCATGLLISLGGMALGYVLLGHPLIHALYQGATGTFLDGIITGQHIHPIEHYYAVADQHVLKPVVPLCLLVWGLFCFSCPSPTWLLVLLLATDLVFIALDCLYGAAAGLYESDFAITRNWGYGEIFQYVKEASILLFFFLFFLQHRHVVTLGWQIFFLYILLDDSLELHETLGRGIAESFHFSPLVGLQAKDFGELAVSAFFGFFILSLLNTGYYYATSTLRKIFRHLFGLLIILAVCGVIFDMVQQMIGPSTPLIYTILGIADDGGEMVTLSVIAWYVHRLTTNWPRRFAGASVSVHYR